MGPHQPLRGTHLGAPFSKTLLSSPHADGTLSRMSAGFWPMLPVLASLWGNSAAPQAPVADTPNPWCWLARYDKTTTRAEFEGQVRVYDPKGALAKYAVIDDAGITLFPSDLERRIPQFHLDFAPSIGAAAAFPKTFRSPAEFRALKKPSGKPLSGLKVAIDPGHIGGEWGQVEDRSIFYDGIGRIQEGDMNLITSAILVKSLTELGAQVFVTRSEPEPVTDVRPSDLADEAEALILKNHPNLVKGHIPRDRIELATHLLFERKYEFLARGDKIRAHFDPDITVVLYINATPSSGRGHLIGVNQNIFFVEGAYLPEEVAQDDQRERLVYKALDRVAPVEYQVAAAIASAFQETTHLPPVAYGDSPTTRLIDPANYYVVARNLGANRQYDGPVVTTEPYFMNHRVTAQRLVAGDYDGERVFGGAPYPSIFREYADCVKRGLLAAYGGAAPAAATAQAAPR